MSLYRAINGGGVRRLSGKSEASFITLAIFICHSDSKCRCSDSGKQVDKLVDVRDQIPQVRKVIYEDPRGMRDYRSDDWFFFIEDLYEMGAAAHT